MASAPYFPYNGYSGWPDLYQALWNALNAQTPPSSIATSSGINYRITGARGQRAEPSPSYAIVSVVEAAAAAFKNGCIAFNIMLICRMVYKAMGREGYH